MAQTQALYARAAAEPSTTPVRVWLAVLAALVFLMVSVGGATRLTGSGLSITEWKPIIGVLPPLSDADWHDAFEKYRQIPQYHQINRGMSLVEFKTIFWWEWTHRFLGRLVGVVFLLPFLYFIATGQIGRKLAPKLIGIFALGGLQGFAGWYMVSSGLTENVAVSHYRLAGHLGLAIVIFGTLIWVALSLDENRSPERSSTTPPAWPAAFIVVAVFVQILLGGLVAGLRAGLAYNTWPLMDGRLIPKGLGAMEPWYLNLLENAMTVQFNHRIVAYVLVGIVLWHVWIVMTRAAQARVRRSAALLALAVLGQALLGIWTLLAHVPLALGLAHQAGAAAVFGLAVWHLHTLRRS